MNDVIYDGENYYLFRALSIENIKDEREGKKGIRTNSIRQYEKNGTWGKYDDKSSLSLEELYDHIKVMHRYDTNCISLTRNANVVLTYNAANQRYALIQVRPEEMNEYFEAGGYFKNTINNRLKNALYNLDNDQITKRILKDIENVSTKQGLRDIIKNYHLTIPENVMRDKKLEINKLLTKIAVLENVGGIEDIVKGVPNSRLVATMKVANSSSEYIHYGDISEDKVIQCPKIFVDIFSLLQQKQQENIADIEEIIKQMMVLVKDGYDINIENGKAVFGNEKNKIELNKNDVTFLLKDYLSNDKRENGISIEKAYELTNGRISYKDTDTQIRAIRALAEMRIKKQIITDILQRTVKENVDVQRLLNGTYCINPELVIRQNSRGHKISESVGILISNKGYELDKDITHQILMNIDKSSTEELLDIYFYGVNSSQIEKMLIKQSNPKKQWRLNYQRPKKVRYTVEGIVEGLDWKSIGRPLTNSEKERLGRKIIVHTTSENEILDLYLEMQKIKSKKREFTQEEIFASIINIAIDGKLGNVSYKDLLESSDKDKILLQNIQRLQTTLDTVQLDLLMNRGRQIKALKQELIDLGLDEEFLEEKDIKNVYMAKKIVDNYQFRDELKPEEKRAILKSILMNKHLNKDNSRYLSNLVNNFRKIGLTNQDAYGIIINSSIEGSAIEETGYDYSVLIHSPSKIFELSQKTKKLNTIVKLQTIQKAKANSIDEEQSENIKQELIDLGIEEEFIEQKDIRNIYMAKKIAENYKFDNELKPEEKGAIIKSLLDSYSLDKRNSCYLTTAISNLKEIGLEEQDIYGVIINFAIKTSKEDESGYDYDSLLTKSSSTVKRLLENEKKLNKRVSSVITKIATINQASKIETNKIRQELLDLGIEEEFLKQKDIKNICMAKSILDSYQFDKELELEEKRAILRDMLSNVVLNNGYGRYLTTLACNLEKIGLTEQQVYGTIINLAINGNIINKKGYFYSTLLGSKEKTMDLYNYKEEIDMDVNPVTIHKAMSNNINEEQEEKVKQELIGLGLDEEFVEQKDIKNLYIAKTIVEEYQFDEELKPEEKRAILKEILKKSTLNKGQTSYLSAMTTNFRKLGLGEQEIYGAIINLAVNGDIIDEPGYSYNKLQVSPKRIIEMKSFIADIYYKVNSSIIQKAVGNNIDKKQEDELTQDLINLGIEEEFIERKDIRNIHMANKILDEYQFEEELAKEQKKAIFKTMIANKGMDNDGHMYIVELANSLERIGLTKQEIYGTIINLAANGSVTEETGYDYSKLLKKPSKIAELVNYKIETKVSKETIENAQKKATQMMIRAIKRLKKDGKIHEIAEVNKKLEELIEKSIDNVKDIAE